MNSIKIANLCWLCFLRAYGMAGSMCASKLRPCCFAHMAREFKTIGVHHLYLQAMQQHMWEVWRARLPCKLICRP